MNNKRGQVTIFIIVAILIIVIGALIYMLSPGLRSAIGQDPNNPYEFIKTCLEEDVENNIALVSSQGGSMDPEHYYLYADTNIEYLCYTNEAYETCIIQQPMLKQHVEKEIKSSLESLVDQCFYSMEESFDKKGYGVDLKEGSFDVMLMPNQIDIIFEGYEFTISKDEVERYDKFKVEILNNNLYELINIANSILEWETSYGNSETTIYMDYYHNLKVEKKAQEDGTTVYILTNRDTGNKFQFASRSLVFPSGY